MDDQLAPSPALTILTGAGGWFGQALLRGYRSESPVLSRVGTLRVLVQRPDDVAAVQAAAPDAEVVVGDVNDSDALHILFRNAAGASVVHAAGVIHPAKVADFHRVNVEGTRAMLAASRRADAARFVYLSSNSPFGVNPISTDTFHADEPYRPYLGYGQSKMLGELEVRESQNDGLDTVILRPPWFYGPWQPARQTQFFKMVRSGMFPIMGRGDQRRSMVYVENLAQGVVLAERHPRAVGRAFWIADRRPYPITEIVDTVKEVMARAGYSVRRHQLRVPFVTGQIAERVDRLLQGRGRYHQGVHVLGEMNKTIACDITPACEQLGYSPDVDLAEGMRRSIEWCREQGIEL
jgi:nucleoside-diphosphate-sugar epimerase